MVCISPWQDIQHSGGGRSFQVFAPLSCACCHSRYLRHQWAVFALAKWNLGFRFPRSSPASLVDQHRPHESGRRDPGCLQWKCEIVNLDPKTYENPWMIGKCCFRVKECRPLKWNVLFINLPQDHLYQLENFLCHFFMTHWPTNIPGGGHRLIKVFQFFENIPCISKQTFRP